MKKRYTIITMLVGIAPLLFADTNALIEVKRFKTWVVKNEQNFYAIAIKNIGTEPILLAKTTDEFYLGQLSTRSLDNKLGSPPGGPITYDEAYEEIEMFEKGRFEPLPVGETRVFEGRKFLLSSRAPFAETMQYKVSVYLGNNFWLDSEPLTVHGIIPDSEEYVATVGEANFPCDLVAVTYKSERWLYVKTLPNEQLRSAGGSYYSICPVSLTNKIRVEPHDGKSLYKIWDGGTSMIYRDGQTIIVEGSDEHNVLGKWARERKQQAEADNAEVRRQKAEVP